MAPLESIGNTDGSRPLSSPCLLCYLVVLTPTLHQQPRPPYSSPRVSSIRARVQGREERRVSEEASKKDRERKKESGSVSLVINFRPSTSRSAGDTIRDTSTAVSFVTLYREYERGVEGRRNARRGTIRAEASRDRFQRGELPNCSTTRAFYFHEFRRTSARNHNQPCSRPPPPQPGLSGLPLGRLLWIVSRESNDRDEADEMERGLQLPKSICRLVSPRSVVVVVDIWAGVHS